MLHRSAGDTPLHRLLLPILPLLFIAVGCVGTGITEDRALKHDPPGHAVFLEYGRRNEPMKPGMNRRAFNTVGSSAGAIADQPDPGIVRIEPGTCRITGFSQLIFAPSPDATSTPRPEPGYCILYDRRFENDRTRMVANALAIGDTAESANGVPSRFDTITRFDEVTEICLGHQSGRKVEGLYLTCVDDDPAGPSYNRPFAQVTIVRLGD
ncbi:MAG: hypothetical protein P8P71_05935 [Phycisphaerales bacterium]|nr:hypothetical protein [Phycisphaerales bacterium]